MILIEKATIKSIPTIQQLSNVVWPNTFSDILSNEQIDYMMEMMYSNQALEKQMSINNHCYLLAKIGEEYVAYLSYELDVDKNYIKIHKIYVLPTMQGKGIGKALIDYVVQIASDRKQNALRLNVNRFNKALHFYQYLGFEVIGSENIDIGNGFVMEDYILEMQIE